MYLAPAAPLPPSLPRASQLAARALDGQVELVVRAVGAVRVGVPLLHQRLVAGVLRLLLQVERLVAVDELVRLGVAELRALLGLDAAKPQKVRPQSLHTTLGVWLISWPTTVTVAQILPVRNGKG